MTSIIARVSAVLILGVALTAGRPGWQWLFIIEGCLTIIYGIVLKVLLAPTPGVAWFLKPAERTWLQQRQDNIHLGAMANSGGRGSTIMGALTFTPCCAFETTALAPLGSHGLPLWKLRVLAHKGSQATILTGRRDYKNIFLSCVMTVRSLKLAGQMSENKCHRL